MSFVVVLYGRVSGHDQQADLRSQMEALVAWARRERPGQEVVELSDIGSGLKADRKQLRRMLRMIQNDHVAEVVVTSADRLTSFGLEYLTLFFAGYGVRFTSFPGRLYGMRSHKQKEIAACIEEVLHAS